MRLEGGGGGGIVNEDSNYVQKLPYFLHITVRGMAAVCIFKSEQ